MRSSDLRDRPPGWSYTDFRFRAMPRIKSSQIHSSQAVAGRRLEYGGHTTTPGSIILRVLTPMSPPCVFKVMRGALSQAGLFESSFILAQKPPTFVPLAAAQLGAAPAPTSSRGAYDAEGTRECNSGLCRKLRLGSCLGNILLIEVTLEGHVGCGTATRGAAHLPQTYFVVSSELEWRPMA
jgi:hypothetical protein